MNLQDVREYLLQTNAIDEAEEILLQDLLQKSNANRDAKIKAASNYQKEKVPKPGEKENSFDPLKISELLKECEDAIDNKSNLTKYINSQSEKERSKYQDNQESDKKDIRKLLSTDLRNNSEIDLEELERLAQDEIIKLEQNKLEIQRKLEDQKLLMSHAGLLNGKQQNGQSGQNSNHSNKYPIMDLDTTLQLQQRLLDESNEFIHKSSKQKADILANQHELQLVNNMLQNNHNGNSNNNYLFSKDSSYLKNIINPPSLLNDRPASSNSPSSSFMGNIDSLKQQEQQNRIQNILSNIANEDYIQEKRKEIELLKNIELEKQKYESISLESKGNKLSNIPSTASLPSSTITAPTGPPKKSLISSDGKVDRTIPTDDFLEKWLREEVLMQPTTTSNSSSTTNLVPSSSSLQPKPTGPANFLTSAPNVNTSNNNNGGVNGMKDVFDNMNLFKNEPNLNESNTNNQQKNEQQQRKFLFDNSRSQGNSSSSAQNNPNNYYNNNNPGNNNFNNNNNNNNGNDYYNPKYPVDTNFQRDNFNGNRLGMNGQQQQPGPGNNNFYPPGAGRFPNNNNNPGMMMGGGYPPQSMGMQQQPMMMMNPPSMMNPTGAGLVNMQMQKIADQLEMENRMLMQQINPVVAQQQLNPFDPAAAALMMDPSLLGGMVDPSLAPPPFGMNPLPFFPNPNLPNNTNVTNPNNLYPLRRDDPNYFSNSINKKELQRQDEIRALQYEIEKLKYEKQLNDMKFNYEKEKLKVEKELEYELSLEKSKNELQLIKMQQIIAKEKKLLELQEGAMNGGGGGGGDENNRGGGGGGMDEGLNNAIREDAGCGLFPVPFDLAKGVSVIVDGVILPRALCTGNYYRIALGIYDKTGKSVVKLIATQWNNWKSLPMLDNFNQQQQSVKASTAQGSRRPGSSSAAPPPSVVKGAKMNADYSILEVEILSAVIFQNLKNSEIMSILFGSSGSSAIGTGNAKNDAQLVDYLLGLKCLIELQIKENENSPQQSLGFASIPLFNTTITGQAAPQQQPLVPPSSARPSMSRQGAAAAANNNVAIDQIVVKNNLWKGAIRKGMSDPLLDPSKGPPNKEDLLSDNSFFFIRILDFNEFLRASTWKAVINGSISQNDLLKIYRDPYNTSKLEIDISNLGNVPGGGMKSTSSLLSRPPSTSLKAPNPNSISSPALAPPPSSRQSGKLTTPLMKNNPRMNRDSSIMGLETLEEVEDLDDPSSNGKRNPFNSLDEESSKLNTKNLPKKARNISSDEYWLLGNPLGPCSLKYERGDGIDIYIDAGRYLPDNVTITRCSLRFFTSNKQQINNNKVYSCISTLNSSSIHPIFSLKAELRGNNLNHSLIGIIRLDTIDSSTLLPGTIGYAIFKVFATRDRKTITNIQENNIYINTGAYQLPIYAGKIASELIENFDENLLINSNCTKLPCSSILMRIFAAPKSSDGITTLSRDEFPKEEWIKLKLDYPLPDYSSGTYSGNLCEPNNSELLAYEAKSVLFKTKPLTTENALLQAMNAHPKNLSSSLPSRPSSLTTTTGGMKTLQQIEEEIKYYESFFPSLDNMRTMIDYNFMIPYHLDSGIFIKIHSLYNLPDYYPIISQLQQQQQQGNNQDGLFSGILVGRGNNNNKNNKNASIESDVCYLQKVICSLSPPALYYQDPPLSDHVFWTKTMDNHRNTRNPSYQGEENYCFYPSEMSFNLYLILDVRTVRMSTMTTPAAPPPATGAGGGGATNNNGTGDNNNNNGINPAGSTEEQKKLKFSLFKDPILENHDLLFQSLGNSNNNNHKKKSNPSTALDNMCKNYWTLLPISCEKYPGNGFKYVASGFFQLPLFEGSFPSTTIHHSANSILKAFNLYEETCNRLALTDSLPSLTNFIKLSSDGASILVQLFNPLLQDFYAFPPPKPSAASMSALSLAPLTSVVGEPFRVVNINQPNEKYLWKIFELLKAKNPHGNKDFDEEVMSVSQLFSGGGGGGGGNGGYNKNNLMKGGKFLNPNFFLKIEQFKYSSEKFVHGNPSAGAAGAGGKGSAPPPTMSLAGGKVLSQALPSHLSHIQLMKEINNYFLSATGLHDF